jgi:hypothetical protein
MISKNAAAWSCALSTVRSVWRVSLRNWLAQKVLTHTPRRLIIAAANLDFLTIFHYVD